MSEIHVCPYCESDYICLEYENEWNVACDNCGAGGPSAATAQAAIDAWNLIAKRDWDKLAESRELLAG